MCTNYLCPLSRKVRLLVSCFYVLTLVSLETLLKVVNSCGVFSNGVIHSIKLPYPYFVDWQINICSCLGILFKHRRKTPIYTMMKLNGMGAANSTGTRQGVNKIRRSFTFLLILSGKQQCTHDDKWYLTLGLCVREQ